MKDFNIEEHLPEGFSDKSRIWIYQANKLFPMAEAFQLEDQINYFISNWNSHGDPVKGWANLFFGRFLIIMADETNVGVSGCSTDSSVRFVKDLEKMFHTNFFDRQLLCFYINQKVEMIPLSQLEYAIKNNFVTPETLYFNNTIQTKEQLLHQWIVPAGETWLRRYFAEKPA